MATEPRRTGVTYEVLWDFPEDNTIREVLEGELFVTAAPIWRHSAAASEIQFRLTLHAKEHGGRAVGAVTGVFLSEENFVEPDVLYLGPASLHKIERPFVRGAPDILVEVSSPSTRRRDLGVKLRVYERFSVPEYWFVDLDADVIEVRRLEGGRYPEPTVLGRGDTLTSPQLAGFEASVDELLGPPETA